MSFGVVLHVYDLSGGLAAQFSRQMVGKQIDGIWHTGIVVYGKEFYFGGGISYDLPACTPFGQPTKRVELGVTEIPEEMFMELMKDIAPRFTEATYNVLTNNCNNFTDECAMLLIGEGIPKEITGLPQEFMRTPLGQQMMPMMMQMQDNLKMNSNQLFANDGEIEPLHVRQPGQERQQQRPGQGMGGMGGMPGMGGGRGGQPNMDQMQQFMQAFQGMNGGHQQQQSFAQPKQGEVLQITSLAHLQLIIKEQTAVVVDFWSPTCPPCMRFKPIFENTAAANQNPKIVFCAVNVQSSQDIAQSFNIRSIPQFNFYLSGKEQQKFTGADENKFRAALAELHKETSSKAGEHMNLEFKHFKPMNRLPVCFTNQGQIDKMKEFIISFAKRSEKDVKSVKELMAWLEGSMNLEAISKAAIDELVELSEIAEDKNKIALVDLFRLLVLKDVQAEYILTKHWELIQVCIIGYLSAQDLKDKEARVIQNYHLASLKFLANIFQTSEGKQIMQNLDKGEDLIEFCSKSFLSCNEKVVYHAALVLFNYILCFENDNKKPIQMVLEVAMKSIDEVLGNINMVDLDTLKALMLCECRILYKNSTMCAWVEEHFKLFFTETHNEVKKRTQHAIIKEAVNDVLCMVNVEDKK